MQDLTPMPGPYQRRSGISPRVRYRAGNHGIHRLVAQPSGM